jgi:hypothetical protein
MPKSVRIVPETESDEGQIITFVLAIGSVRQVCRLETTFQTQNQALSYLHKHRTAFEHLARASLARGEVKDGVIHLTMASSDGSSPSRRF